MVRLKFDSDMFELVRAARFDTLAALQCLQIFVARLRAKAVVDDELTEHIIAAFEAAIEVPASQREKVLGGALFLTARNNLTGQGGKRKRADYLKVGQEMNLLLSSGLSETKAKATLAKKWGISARTIKRGFDEYEAARDAHDKIE